MPIWHSRISLQDFSFTILQNQSTHPLDFYRRLNMNHPRFVSLSVWSCCQLLLSRSYHVIFIRNKKTEIVQHPPIYCIHTGIEFDYLPWMLPPTVQSWEFRGWYPVKIRRWSRVKSELVLVSKSYFLFFQEWQWMCVLDYLYLQRTMMMGADFYQTEAEIASAGAQGKIPIGVGRNTRIW